MMAQTTPREDVARELAETDALLADARHTAERVVRELEELARKLRRVRAALPAREGGRDGV